MTTSFSFPSGFHWGAATASYQIEGAVRDDGRGESIWDRWSHIPGNTVNGDTGDVACDHYHRWREDIQLMQQLGITAYRFSIAWPRVIPTGTGEVSAAGIGFYDRLVDALLEVGITPFPTLYHWDLPQVLEDDGGWPERRTAYAFADYATAVADRLGDRVKHWWTINEPFCVADLGYRVGTKAPGRHDHHDFLAAAHHVLLGHGLAVTAIKAASPDAQVGIVANVDNHMPRSAHPADRRAAELAHAIHSGWYLDPVFRGEYPEAAVNHHHWDQREVAPGDMEIISTRVDHHGVNYYTRKLHGDEGIDDLERPAPILHADLHRTTMGWEVYPDGLRELLVRFNEEYDLPPVYITENGAAFPDEVVDGAVHDGDRRDYLERHFSAAAEAVAAGVDLRGYFVWSLMDNYEWARGYGQRFGLVRVDYETQERILKDSAHWYASVIAAATGSIEASEEAVDDGGDEVGVEGLPADEATVEDGSVDQGDGA
ncbi:MAG: GH1 family beta-glucosidase [Acidimicrobiia bacterium]|nr:GH1 family beta-glucosidase [Acidimicrobiia bacterium]